MNLSLWGHIGVTLSVTHTTTNGSNWVARFMKWCDEVERSCIEVLQDFADLRRGYTLQTTLAVQPACTDVVNNELAVRVCYLRQRTICR